MSYNGSGTFQINTTGQPVVAGTVISSTAFNALTADLATGLSTAITKDGQTATTARIPFAAGISSTLVTDSTSISTGSIITAGGAGIAKALYVGTTANVAGAATLGSTLTYGGVTLTNAVTGTGKMVLDTSPTITGLTANGVTATLPVINNIKMGYSTTATAAGTTTLTVSSNYRQFFTGTLAQTIVLPVTSTLVTGMAFEIENNSTGLLTVNSSGGNLVGTIPAGVCAHAVCIGITLTTAADWDWDYISTTTITGTGANVLGTSPTITTPTISSLSSAAATALTLQSAGTTAITVDTSQNVGIGVTPSAWASSYKAIQLAGAAYGGGSFITDNGSPAIAANAYNNAGWKYVNTDFATIYLSRSGQHQWFNAPSGTAGAAITLTQAMTLDASGNLGIGTTSPISNSGYGGLSVNGTSGAVVSLMKAGTETGRIFTGGDETSFQCKATTGYITFVSGVSGGTERMRIDSSGNLLVGTTSALSQTGRATFVSSGNALVTQVGNSSTAYQSTNTSGTSAYYAAIWSNNGNTFSTCGTIQVSGTATSYNTSSDYRLKDNVLPMTGALAKIALLKPVTYKWKSDGSDGQGFIAHELAEVMPDCVSGKKDAVKADGSIMPQGVDTSFLVATLTKAIQEQQALITALTARITALESK
jgi:hypothetical protein